MSKLIRGFEINCQKNVHDEYKHIHFSDTVFEIRSKYTQEEILDVDPINKILPGNLGKYIYPYDSILIFKDGTKINKSNFNKLMNDKSFINRAYKRSDLIFDVPNVNDIKEEQEEEEECENDEESEDGIDLEDVESDQEDWEEEDVEEFEDLETTNPEY